MLVFPTNVLTPNLGVAAALCTNLASGSCTPIGSATAVSPVYPTPLSGKAYLTGNSSGLKLTLVFPAPFSLTLTGSVNLATNTTTFNGIPDIPLSQLEVVLNGGTDGAFATTCQTSSGTATAKVVSQNGDLTRNLSAPFTVSGWKPCTGAPPGSGSGSSGGSGRAAAPAAAGPGAAVARRTLRASAAVRRGRQGPARPQAERPLHGHQGQRRRQAEDADGRPRPAA